MKYDLMITCMFSFSKEKYIKAFNNFLEHGLLNIKDRKILLNALIDEEIYEEFLKYNFKYPVKVYTYKYDNVSQKIYTFYKDNIKNISDSTRWHIQVDDDSSTDVDGLLSKLDKIYNPDIPMHIICGSLNDLNSNLKKIFLEYNFPINESIENLTFYKSYWEHEWEFSIQSYSFFKTINESIKNDALDALIKNNGFSDHGLSALAVLNKIPIIPCKFAHFSNILNNFSLNGGNFYHIHYLKDQDYNNLINLEFIKSNLVGKHCLFYGFNNQEGYTLYCNNFILNEDFSVTSCDENEKFWKISEDNLIILNKDKSPTSFFKTNKKIFDATKALIGQFTLYNNINSAYIKIL